MDRFYTRQPGQSLYTYRFIPERCVDGDTIDGTVDLGFTVKTDQRFRLYGIDTPELRPRHDAFATPELREEHIKKAHEAQEFVVNLIKGPLVIQTIQDKTGKYGRYLCWIWAAEWNVGAVLGGHTAPLTINELLVDAGLATRLAD